MIIIIMEASRTQADADKDLSIKTGYMVERVGTPFLFGPTFHFQSAAPETAERDALGWCGWLKWAMRWKRVFHYGWMKSRAGVQHQNVA